jgi:hypothetical protein
MPLNRTRAATEVATSNEQARLRFALAAVVLQAQKLSPGSPARSAMVDALVSLKDGLDDLTGARLIGLDRAFQLAEAAVACGLAQWQADPHGDLFRPITPLLHWMGTTGVTGLSQLHDDEADETKAFITSYDRL